MSFCIITFLNSCNITLRLKQSKIYFKKFNAKNYKLMEKCSICLSEKAEISYNEPYHPQCIENYFTNDFEFKNISEKLIQISYIL